MIPNQGVHEQDFKLPKANYTIWIFCTNFVALGFCASFFICLSWMQKMQKNVLETRLSKEKMLQKSENAKRHIV